MRKSVGVLLASSALVVVGCSGNKEKDPRTEPQLVTVTAAARPSRDSQFFTGVVTCRIQSDLGFRVSGKVVRRLVDVGQTVRAGQPMMRIDVTDYAHEISTQAENVRAARARSEQAAADEARYRGLVATGAVSASTYDQIKATADAAKAQLAAAEAQENIARDQGDYSVLVADADGTVVQTLAEPGQVVGAGQTVVKLAHAGPREAAVFLPETLRPPIGEMVRARLYGKDESVPAQLRQLSDSADPATRTFEARYVLGGSSGKAPLGATVTIERTEHESREPIEVPIGAIGDRGKGPGVWVVDRKNSTVSFRSVKVIRITDENALLDDGVHAGEEIVALGAHLLTEGQHVRVAEQEAASR